ncbi:E3 ubiquitin-protein ligase SINAT5-like [Agrilus planipennis]|uniref:RING-type E3 ubiquitin transferase n=1 Tax=Agrilus planipennis TaxID=224129 RepID=A0A1W4WN84_AGRPL|nr:E3 ubiquitin-protein ligase SINAT5-like [Agrilus planipennis]
MACLSNELLVELECPVCTEFMCPPIRQCVTGHSFCDSCYHKLKDCPTCRKPKGIARSFALEKLYSKLNIPCRNRFDGCKFVDVGRKIKDHEEFCYYGEKECPLQRINNCQWFGKMTSMIDHCKDKHSSNVFVANKQKLTCTNFYNCNSAKACYYILFEAYDELFKCCWEIDVNGLMKWCVYYLGLPRNARNYYYEIEIMDQDPNKSPTNNIVVRSPCKPYPVDNVFNYNNCTLMHYDMVSQYCKDGELMYEVRIIVDGIYKLFNLGFDML